MSEPIQILVVDDDDHERLFLEALLTRMGPDYRVIAVENGCAALQAAQHTTFDVLLTDLKMPRMDGLRLTQTFAVKHSQTAIIWITAYGCHLHQQVPSLPVVCCLDKPVDIAEIRQAVLYALKPDESQTVQNKVASGFLRSEGENYEGETIS